MLTILQVEKSCKSLGYVILKQNIDKYLIASKSAETTAIIQFQEMIGFAQNKHSFHNSQEMHSILITCVMNSKKMNASSI